MRRSGRGASGPARAGPGLLAGLAVASCGWQGPGLGGYGDGLQYKVTSFYAAHAVEKHVFCTQPMMTPVRAEVVSETPERILMKVRYHWWDESQRSSEGTGDGQRRRAGGMGGYCNGWAERTFTIAKRAGGGLEVVGMTGATRG